MSPLQFKFSFRRRVHGAGSRTTGNFLEVPAHDQLNDLHAKYDPAYQASVSGDAKSLGLGAVFAAGSTVR